ncbi:MAG TPA: HAD family phosphatase [Prolixibacteraceae bacterium]
MERTPEMIENILFDLGGVLLTIDVNKTAEAFTRLGWGSGYPVFENVEVGKDNPDQFRENIRKVLPGKVSDEEIDQAWNAMLVDFPSQILEYVESLKPQYKLYLLSNTNELHVKRFKDIFYSKFGYDFDDLFVKAYFSNEIGFRKPDTQAYVSVLTHANLKPESTLFVDDLKLNTDAAAKLGMQVLHIEPGKLMDYLPAYLRK